MEIIVPKTDYENPADTPYLLKDLIQGDEAVADRQDFQRLSDPEIQKGLQLILNNPCLSDSMKELLLLDSWRINYKSKPPTIKEFLTEEWLGPQAESLFVHARRILTEFWNYDSPYRHLVLAGSIGTGKALPVSTPVAVDEEDVLEFNFENCESLIFRPEEKILIQENSEWKVIKAREIRDRELDTIDFPYEVAYLCMMKYRVNQFSEFKKAFDIESYEELISFFKQFSEDFYRENEIFINMHHIIPRCEGGQDLKENLISLPFYFHIKAHYLRAKEQHKQGQLRYAYCNYIAAYRASGLVRLDNLDSLKSDIEFYANLDIAMESFELSNSLQKEMFFVSKKGEKSKKIFADEWEFYKKEGWKKGRVFSDPTGKKWMHKGTKNIYVYPDEIDSYLEAGYFLGMHVSDAFRKSLKTRVVHSTLGTKWMHKGSERKCVKIEQVEEYLKEGWELGSASKTVAGQSWKWKESNLDKYHWFTDGKTEILCEICPEGFQAGRLPNQEAKRKSSETMKALYQQPEYKKKLSDSHKGQPSQNKGKIGITNGIINTYIRKDESVPEGFRVGWTVKGIK